MLLSYFIILDDVVDAVLLLLSCKFKRFVKIPILTQDQGLHTLHTSNFTAYVPQGPLDPGSLPYWHLAWPVFAWRVMVSQSVVTLRVHA